MREFGGKVAVVTGAGSGIGRALALRFAAEGMKLALADIEQAALDETAALAGGSVLTRIVDVGDEKAMLAFADDVYAEYGAVHVLCNNAGVFCGGALWSRPVSDFDWVLRVNFYGVLHGIRSFVPRMIAQDTEGHIVTTSSVAGLFAAPFSAPYTVSKYAARSITESLAHELQLAGSKLKVSVLCPGGVQTQINASGRNRPADLAAESTDDQVFVDSIIDSATEAGIPPADVAEAVVDAIRDERFLILTHPAYAQVLKNRPSELLEGRLPSLPDVEAY